MPYCINCGGIKTKLNRSSLCKECSNANFTVDRDSLDNSQCNEGRASNVMPVNDGMNEYLSNAVNHPSSQSESHNFWVQMNNLLDKKFETFEDKLNNSIKEQVKIATDPMKTELTKLSAANKSLKTEITMLKAKQKAESERNDKIVKVLKEHHVTMGRNDKEKRFKRLLLSGVSEEQITIDGVACENDKEKVSEIFKIMQVEDVILSDCKRIGAKDRGQDKRPRFILLDFMNASDRNRTKRASAKLKENKETERFFLKIDKTKKEREEYTRLYKIKEQLQNDDKDKVVEIKFGKLYVDETIVDQVETENNDFLL